MKMNCIKPNDTTSTHNEVLKKVLIGGVSATTGILAGLPFMNVKNELQRNPSLPFSRRVQLLNPFFQNPAKFFTGSFPLIISAFPSMGVAHSINWIARKHAQKEDYRLTSIESAVFSVASGGITSVFVSPAELLFIRMGVTKKPMLETGTEIYQKTGFKGFLRGINYTAVRMAVFTSVYHELGYDYPLIASIVGATITHPFDTAKTLLQSDLKAKVSLWKVITKQPFDGLSSRIFAYTIFMYLAPKIKKALDD